jgi:predicted nucleic acid-binding protein
VSFLVDTDVLSDPSRPQPSPKVDAWLVAHQSQLYTSAISIGEIKRGIERLPTGAKRNGLEKWLEAVLASMDGRILAYNSRVAETWGAMMANLERQGRPMPLTDSLIAAIAKRHTLTLVTRNTADFAHTGLRVANSFL